MEKKTTSALILSAALAGVGVGRATVPGPPDPTVEKICIYADSSATLDTDAEGKKLQLLVPPNHALPVMRRSGGKAADLVPPKLSAAIRACLSEAGRFVTDASASGKLVE